MALDCRAAVPFDARIQQMTAEDLVARVQGAYFVASGGWPILSPRSFQRVTGPKSDMWLAQTVGGLIAVVGAVLVRPTADRRTRRLLGIGSAAVLGTADLVFVLSGRIRPVYLVDAFIEGGLGLAYALVSQREVVGKPVPSRDPERGRLGDAKAGQRVAPGRTGAAWSEGDSPGGS